MMNEKVAKYNLEQKEMGNSLPNLFVAIKEYKKGNENILKSFFYVHKSISTNYIDGKKVVYENNYIKFWDKQLNNFLHKMKKKYSRGNDVSGRESYKGQGLSVNQSSGKFEEDEIDSIFYTYIIDFASSVNIDQFKEEKEEHTLNSLRKFIRIQFENDYLKKIYHDRMGVDRVRVDGVDYYVKTQDEDVYFDDVYMGQDSESGETLNLQDILEEEEDITFSKGRVGLFIEENYEKVITKNQLKKFKMIEHYIEENGLENLFQKHDNSKFNKAELARILFPDRSTSSCVKDVDAFINSMRGRMEKQLKREGLFRDDDMLVKNKKKAKKDVEKEIYPVYVYSGGNFTQEEVDKYFDLHVDTIMSGYKDGMLKYYDDGEKMIPNSDKLLPISYEQYDMLKSSKRYREQVIRESYNPDKFKLKAGVGELVSVIKPEDMENKNGRQYISESKLRELRG